MEEIMMQQPSQVITNTIQLTEYNLYLHGEIGSPDSMMEHFAVYKSAREGDQINLYVNSGGGSLATGMEYIRHMRECPANITAVIGVEAASMASAICLEADEIEVDEMSTFLIHSFQYGATGSEYSVFNQAQFNKRLNERWIKSHYEDFLSEKELEDVFKGVDILLDSDQIVEYWNARERKRAGDCSCGKCPDEWGDEEEWVDDVQPVGVLDCNVTNSFFDEDRNEAALTVRVDADVYEKIKNKKIQIVVDTEDEDGA